MTVNINMTDSKSINGVDVNFNASRSNDNFSFNVFTGDIEKVAENEEAIMDYVAETVAICIEKMKDM